MPGRIAPRLLAPWLLLAGVLPVRAAEPDFMVLPTLTNTESVRVHARLAGVTNGIAIDGTVFAVFRIGIAGQVKPLAYYGAPMRDPQAARVVQELTEMLHYAPVPAAWKTAHPDRLWAAYWMFQTDGCDSRIYDSPRDVTAIRVCVRVKNGTVAAGDTDTLIELPGVPPVTRFVVPQRPTAPCNFLPLGSRTAGAVYASRVIMEIGVDGTVRPVLAEQITGIDDVDWATFECMKRQKWLDPETNRPPAPGYARSNWRWRVVDRDAEKKP